MSVEALTKPSFTSSYQAPEIFDSLPGQLVTSEHSSLAQHVIAGYKALRAQAVKTYDSMLKPLNKKRGVILGWKRDDLVDIDQVIEAVTERLNDYRTREELAREIAAAAALETAQAEAERLKEDDLAYLEEAAATLEDVDPDKAQVVKAEADELRDAPAPIVAVLDDEQLSTEASPVVERLRYSTEKQVDIHRLAEAVLQGRVSPKALLPNKVWLDGQARSLREEFSIPGVVLQVDRYYVRKGGAS